MEIFYVISFASKISKIISIGLSFILFIRIMQFPVQAWLRITLNHGSITYVTISADGNVGLHMVGDTGFIPSDKVTA